MPMGVARAPLTAAVDVAADRAIAPNTGVVSGNPAGAPRGGPRRRAGGPAQPTRNPPPPPRATPTRREAPLPTVNASPFGSPDAMKRPAMPLPCDHATR